ncbi:MAG TPA: hypothetical protein VF718_15520 [Allosphingosinicella sp.]|jgi:hypothetical protein
MTHDAPITAATPDRASQRAWIAPRVQQLIATSAEAGPAGRLDSNESLS